MPGAWWLPIAGFHHNCPPPNILSSMLSISSSTDIDCQRNNHEHDYLVMMVIMIRHGHKCAAINPVALEEPKPVPELDPARSSSYLIFPPPQKKKFFWESSPKCVLWDLGERKVKFRSKKAIFRVIWGEISRKKPSFFGRLPLEFIMKPPWPG